MHDVCVIYNEGWVYKKGKEKNRLIITLIFFCTADITIVSELMSNFKNVVQQSNQEKKKIWEAEEDSQKNIRLC